MELKDGLKRSLESSVARPPFELVEQRADEIVRRRRSRVVTVAAGIVAATVVFAVAAIAPDGGAVPEVRTGDPAAPGKNNKPVNLKYDWDLRTVKADLKLPPRFRSSSQLTVMFDVTRQKGKPLRHEYTADLDLRRDGKMTDTPAIPSGSHVPSEVVVAASTDATKVNIQAPFASLPTSRFPLAWKVRIGAGGNGPTGRPEFKVRRTYIFTTKPIPAVNPHTAS